MTAGDPAEGGVFSALSDNQRLRILRQIRAAKRRFIYIYIYTVYTVYKRIFKHQNNKCSTALNCCCCCFSVH